MSLELEEEIDFTKIYAAQRHKELIAALKQLSQALKKEEGKEDELAKALSVNKTVLDSFLIKLKELTAQETKTPIVNVEQEKVVKEISELKQIIDKKEWVFTVTRDQQTQRIVTVIAKPK